MRLHGAVPVVACCLLAACAIAVAACGSGSSADKAPDSSKVPTATLPASLPQPQIIGSGAVQPGGASSYTVKDGDTLAGIAARFGVSLDDLRAANPNVDASSLSIGQSIKLPAPSDQAAASPATATPPPEPTQAADTPTPSSLGQTYVVQPGDIPVNIAARFGITVEELMAANPGVDPTNMHAGDVLIIPPKRQG